MTKPSLDQIETDIIAARLHNNLTHPHPAHIDFPLRDEQARQIETDKARYKQLTGREYVLPQMELPLQ